MFKLFSYSDMGMLFQRSHISFQTTGKRIRIHSHFFEIQKLVTSIVRTRVRGTSSADNRICIYIICLSAYVCKDDDVRLRRFNAYYLLRQFVGCFTNERKLDRKYYIKTLDLIVQGMHFSGQSARIYICLHTLTSYIAGNSSFLFHQFHHRLSPLQPKNRITERFSA